MILIQVSPPPSPLSPGPLVISTWTANRSNKDSPLDEEPGYLSFSSLSRFAAPRSQPASPPPPPSPSPSHPLAMSPSTSLCLQYVHATG